MQRVEYKYFSINDKGGDCQKCMLVVIDVDPSDPDWFGYYSMQCIQSVQSVGSVEHWKISMYVCKVANSHCKYVAGMFSGRMLLQKCVVLVCGYFLIVSNFWCWLWQLSLCSRCISNVVQQYLVDLSQDYSAPYFCLIANMIAHFWYVSSHFLRLLYSSFGAIKFVFGMLFSRSIFGCAIFDYSMSSAFLQFLVSNDGHSVISHLCL